VSDFVAAAAKVNRRNRRLRSSAVAGKTKKKRRLIPNSLGRM